MKKFADLISKARSLESTLASSVEGAARQIAGSPARQPLEIVHAVVDCVEQTVQPTGRGHVAFPFNQLRITMAAPSTDVKAFLEVACQGPPSLHQRIVERLEVAGCAVPGLDVSLNFVTKAKPRWRQPEFDVEFTRQPVAVPAPAAPTRLELTVTNGTAGRQVYVFANAPITLGRGDEVRDSRHRVIRTNQVAFVEGGGDVNHSVSRRHARIEHDTPANAFRVFDDGSAQGTTVIRQGRGLPVPRGAKGLRLQSGDEIVLGQARVRVGVQLGST
jgi:hypothetical protein